MNGQTLAFSESDLQAAVAAYNPELHEAPLVVGHPRHDLPAYGWVQSLSFSEDAAAPGIYATPAQVNPDFADMVAAGAFKKISAAFFSPTAPGNPVPGTYYLRHVGFLGAQPPAVKGLRNPTFADSEEGVVTFSEWDDVQNASLWRNLRDWLLGKFGAEAADQVVPGYTVQALERAADAELQKSMKSSASGVSFAEPNPTHQESTVSLTPEQIAALQAENARMQAQIAANAAASAAAAATALNAAHVEFCEVLVGAGQLLPAQTAVVVATLNHLANPADVVEFGEGEAKAPLADALKTFLKSLKPQIELDAVATAARAAGDSGTVAFAAPAGFAVDPMALALHAKALAHQAAKGGTYQAAIQAVQR